MNDCTRMIDVMSGDTVTRVPTHCGHPEGTEATRAQALVVLGHGKTTGVSRATCCYCGETIQVSWSVDDLSIEGHGTWVIEPQRVWHWPVGWE